MYWKEDKSILLFHALLGFHLYKSFKKLVANLAPGITAVLAKAASVWFFKVKVLRWRELGNLGISREKLFFLLMPFAWKLVCAYMMREVLMISTLTNCVRAKQRSTLLMICCLKFFVDPAKIKFFFFASRWLNIIKKKNNKSIQRRHFSN